MDEIALYGWRSNDNLPSTLGFNDNLRITLHIHPFMQPGWADIDTVARQNDASLIITLAIGWYEASDSTMPGVVDDQSKDRWALAAVHSLMRLDTLGELDNKIKFTPHLEDGEHRFCFPTQKPQDIIDADYPHSPIGFHSPCNCGMGDLTGSRFNCTRYYTARSTLTRALFGQYGKRSKLLSEFGCKTDQIVWVHGSLDMLLSKERPFRERYSCTKGVRA